MENSLQRYKLVLPLAFALVIFFNTELSFLASARALDNNSKVYIVYLGKREKDDPELVTASHHQMLESLHESKEDAHNSMIYSYQHGFSGFAALLTTSQANKISEHPEVIHVIPNRILKLKTTRTWELLGVSQIPTSFSPSSTSVKGLLHDTNMGSEAIIGVMDTGIWPESKGESLFTGPEISTGLAFWDSESDDHGDVKGKIVLVFGSTFPVARKGVAGVICAQTPDDLLYRCHAFPCIYTDYELGTDILQYIRTTRSPTVRISAARTLTGLPATTKVAAFSSRGPNSVSPAILKPDIAAPGASILAALSPLDSNEHDGFGLDSGTSMSTPIVSGIIALLRCLYPNWSPAAIRSALVTTAWRTSLSGEPMFAEGSNMKLADPFDYGGGLVNPENAAKPGLVYDMGIEGYINYMCSAGYNDSSISRVLGKKTKCSTPEPSILDINLPSITIPNLEKEVTLTRTVTNVGPIESVYKAVIESPLGITLTVNPTTLVFSSADKKVLSFTVTAKTTHKVNTGYLFGSLTWTDGVHDVKIPVSVKTKIMMIKP